MKKMFLILAIVIGFGIITSAQDMILKIDGSEIKSKVLEITDQQVKYKDFDFQDGPIRNINISEVFMITYENGQKEVFYKQISTPTTQRSGNKMYSNDLKNEFYRIGTNDIEMLHFFRKNEFVKYYNDFEVVCKKRERGINLLIGGVLTTSLGVILMAAGLKEGYYGMTYIGCGIIGIGHVLTIVSIPVSAVGGAKKRIIKNDFAREYFGVDGYTYQPTLNLGYTGNGIGIALKF